MRKFNYEYPGQRWVPKLVLHKMQIIINLLFFTRSRVGIFEWVDYEKERKGLTC